MKLRDYQQKCVDICIDHLLHDTIPVVAELATGAGKSIIVSEIAKKIHEISKKNILCLAPSAELVKQNREKYLTTGNPASVFSASAGGKCLKHPVVFGTPQTVANGIDKFGSRFALVIIDEAHGLTKTVKKIIDELRNKNPNVRVLGLTATPYRMGSGYIYRIDENNKNVLEEQAIEPYFEKLLFKITAYELIKKGYLTPPVIGQIGGEHYDTLHLKTNSMGKFNSKEVDQAFLGKGRKTAYIVQDIVEKSRNRNSVMIFASTVEHAKEVMESLPDGLSVLVTGDTPKKERENIIKQFTANNIKYLVNVAVLTTGFDAPVVDVIALLRATESAGLLQQIIGRGLRLYDGKDDVLILDYAQNIERHSPDGDIFNPTITSHKKGESATIVQECPICKFENTFSLRKNKEGYKIDKDGYFIDLENNRIGNPPLPAHYGRRCQGRHYDKDSKEFFMCSYRWSLKICENCDTENDIAARKCTKCKGELVDPNEKLIIDFKQLKRDPTRPQIDDVLDMKYRKTVSMKGNECLKVDFVTPYRQFSIWLQLESKSAKAKSQVDMFRSYHKNIKTIEYVKEPSGFYTILSYNKEADKCQANT